MKKRNLGVNAILNVVKSGLSIIFPLITYPYALRVLGAENIGKVSYSNSIISYFAMLAMLGVATYGVREGSKIKNNSNQFGIFVNEIFTINMLSTVLSYCLLMLFLTFIHKLQPYTLLILLLSSSIMFTTLGVDWINTVYEDFLVITVRSIFVYIISCVLLFAFVKTSEDYFIYAVLTIIGNIIICISNWFYIRRYAHPKITFHPNFRKHLKPLIIMFSNAIATSIYVNFDTTMLGWMQGDVPVGLYTVSVKVYSIIKGLLAAVYAVAIPRLASYLGSNNYNGYRELYTKLWKYLTILLIPSGVGLACVAPEIMQFMGGSSYSAATLSLQILAFALIFAIYGGLTTAVLNITIGREKDNLIATLFSAIINCVLNFIFIPNYSLYGAAITTCISEAFVLVFCLLRNKNIRMYLSFYDVKKDLLDAGMGSMLIIIITLIINRLVSFWFLKMILIILGSIVFYGIFMILRKNKTCIDLLRIVFDKVRPKEK